MSVTRVPSRRPKSVVGAVATLLFLGATALGGGMEMIVWRHGNRYLPADWLEEIPVVDSYLLPGLLLMTVFGLGSLVVAFGMLRTPTWPTLQPVERATGRHWSWAASVALGVAFTLWLTTELVLLGATDGNTAVATHAVYGTVAAILLVLPHSRSVRRHLTVRLRSDGRSRNGRTPAA